MGAVFCHRSEDGVRTNLPDWNQRSQARLAHVGRVHSEVYSAESRTPLKAALWVSVAPCWRVHIGNNQDGLEFTKFKNLQAITRAQNKEN